MAAVPEVSSPWNSAFSSGVTSFSLLGWFKAAHGYNGAAVQGPMYLMSIDGVIRVLLNTNGQVLVAMPSFFSGYTAAVGSLPANDFTHVAVTVSLTSSSALTLTVLLNGTSVQTTSKTATASAAALQTALNAPTAVTRVGACISSLTSAQMATLGSGWQDAIWLANNNSGSISGPCDLIATLAGVPNLVSSSTTPVNFDYYTSALSEVFFAEGWLNEVVQIYFDDCPSCAASWKALTNPQLSDYVNLYTAANGLTAWNLYTSQRALLSNAYSWFNATSSSNVVWGGLLGQADDIMLFNSTLSTAQIALLTTIPIATSSCAMFSAAQLSSSVYGSLCPLLAGLLIYLPFDQWAITDIADVDARVGIAYFNPAGPPLYQRPILLQNGPLCIPVSPVSTNTSYPTSTAFFDLSLTPCAAGSISAAGNVRCLLCPFGTYDNGHNVCQFCPTDFTNAVAGSTACTVPRDPNDPDSTYNSQNRYSVTVGGGSGRRLLTGIELVAYVAASTSTELAAGVDAAGLALTEVTYTFTTGFSVVSSALSTSLAMSSLLLGGLGSFVITTIGIFIAASTSSGNTCSPVPRGYELLSSTNCPPCAVGFWSPGGPTGRCTPPGRGFYTMLDDDQPARSRLAATKAVQVPAGKYAVDVNTKPAIEHAVDIQPCAAGTYNDQPGGVSWTCVSGQTDCCKPCAEGTYSSSAATVCQQCRTPLSNQWSSQQSAACYSPANVVASEGCSSWIGDVYYDEVAQDQALDASYCGMGLFSVKRDGLQSTDLSASPLNHSFTLQSLQEDRSRSADAGDGRRHFLPTAVTPRTAGSNTASFSRWNEGTGVPVGSRAIDQFVNFVAPAVVQGFFSYPCVDFALYPNLGLTAQFDLAALQATLQRLSWLFGTEYSGSIEKQREKIIDAMVLQVLSHYSAPATVVPGTKPQYGTATEAVASFSEASMTRSNGVAKDISRHLIAPQCRQVGSVLAPNLVPANEFRFSNSPLAAFYAQLTNLPVGTPAPPPQIGGRVEYTFISYGGMRTGGRAGGAGTQPVSFDAATAPVGAVIEAKSITVLNAANAGSWATAESQLVMELIAAFSVNTNNGFNAFAWPGAGQFNYPVYGATTDARYWQFYAINFDQQASTQFGAWLNVGGNPPNECQWKSYRIGRSPQYDMQIPGDATTIMRMLHGMAASTLYGARGPNNVAGACPYPM